MNTAADLVLLGILGGLASKLLDFVRFVRAQDWSAALTQAAAWAAGALTLFVAGWANKFQALPIPGLGTVISDLDGWSKVLIGTSFVSLWSHLVDYKKALDGTQTAAVPRLLPPKDVVR